MTQSPQFAIRDPHGNIYGPAPIEMVRQWIRERRIIAGMWIAAEGSSNWYEVSTYPALADLFGQQALSYASPAAVPALPVPTTVPIELTYNSRSARANPLAIVSFITGILSFCSCCCAMPFLAFAGMASIVLSIVAIVTGIFGIRQIRDNSEEYSGRPFAIAGIILGSLNLLIMIGGIVFIAISIFMNAKF